MPLPFDWEKQNTSGKTQKPSEDLIYKDKKKLNNSINVAIKFTQNRCRERKVLKPGIG